MTLYLFTDDTDEASACIGPCAETWPPHLVDGDLEAGDDADGDLLGTVTRDDGAVQITYGGHPLYRYGPDRQPGDVEGHGVGGVWFAVAPDGSAIGSAAITGPGY